jgi:hypothetical protein
MCIDLKCRLEVHLTTHALSSPPLLLGYRAAGQNPSAAAATPLQLCLGAEAVSGEYFRDGTLDTSDEYCANEADGEVAWRLCEDKLGGVDATSKA